MNCIFFFFSFLFNLYYITVEFDEYCLFLILLKKKYSKFIFFILFFHKKKILFSSSSFFIYVMINYIYLILHIYHYFILLITFTSFFDFYLNDIILSKKFNFKDIEKQITIIQLSILNVFLCISLQ